MPSGDQGQLVGGGDDNRRGSRSSDRRAVLRGGRRTHDKPGAYPPILVADSDDGARRVLTLALARFGFEVLAAATGEDALAFVEFRTPCAAIAELTLPRDDAFQARVRIGDVPYIVTVTNDEQAPPSYAVAVLEKPFSLDVLMAAVFRVVRSPRSPVAV